MKMPSFEDIALHWTLGHTVAAIAWVLVVVLGIATLLQSPVNTYPVTSAHKLYAGENATFAYPENWKISSCVPDEPFITIPGTIGGSYKRKSDYPLVIYAMSMYSCTKGRPIRFDISPETLMASEAPCSIANSTRGERLKNGLYLQLHEDGNNVVAVSIRQNKCYTGTDTSVINFAFADQKAADGDAATYGVPGVKKQTFLASRQYNDIRALAEDIRY